MSKFSVAGDGLCRAMACALLKTVIEAISFPGVAMRDPWRRVFQDRQVRMSRGMPSEATLALVGSVISSSALQQRGEGHTDERMPEGNCVEAGRSRMRMGRSPCGPAARSTRTRSPGSVKEVRQFLEHRAVRKVAERGPGRR